MPNWCYNELYMEGSHPDLEKIRKIDMDFQKILPMPQSMYDDIGDEGANLGGRNMKDLNPEQQKLKQSWIDEFGVDGWYDWSCKNWNTKWTASNVEWKCDGEFQTVKFNTAWDKPNPVIKELSRLFPEVYFSLTWVLEAEQEADNYQNGELVQ